MTAVRRAPWTTARSATTVTRLDTSPETVPRGDRVEEVVAVEEVVVEAVCATTVTKKATWLGIVPRRDHMVVVVVVVVEEEGFVTIVTRKVTCQETAQKRDKEEVVVVVVEEGEVVVATTVEMKDTFRGTALTEGRLMRHVTSVERLVTWQGVARLEETEVLGVTHATISVTSQPTAPTNRSSPSIIHPPAADLSVV